VLLSESFDRATLLGGIVILVLSVFFRLTFFLNTCRLNDLLTMTIYVNVVWAAFELIICMYLHLLLASSEN